MAAEKPPAEAKRRRATSREATRQEARRSEARPPEPAHRLFFALWPDEAMRQAMVQATRKVARASGGRPVPTDNLHVTLAFLGSVPERQVPRLAEIARAAAKAAAGEAPGGVLASGSSPRAALELAFDRLEYWRAARLLCAMPAEPQPPVAALAGALQDLLGADGFTPDLKSPWSVGLGMSRQFRPHVTVARNVRPPHRGMGMDPVIWSFADFALADSKTLPEGSVYTVLESYPLGH